MRQNVRSDMADRLVYLLASLLVGVIRRLPLSVCFVLGQWVGALLWAVLPGYRRLARENLSKAFAGELSAIRALTFRHFTTLGANAVCAFKMPELSQEETARIAKIERLDRIRANIAAGRPVVLAINHIGNWELYAQLIFQVPEARFGTVYQSLRNKLVDDLVNRDRRRLGVMTFDRKKGFAAAIALLREPGIVGVLVDQNAGDAGIWMPFFGRLCSTSPLAATLAIRTNAAAFAEAVAVIRGGAEQLARVPRADMDGFVPCEKDQEREKRYQKRLAEENRIYEAIRAGKKVYDAGLVR